MILVGIIGEISGCFEEIKGVDLRILSCGSISSDFSDILWMENQTGEEVETLEVNIF